MLDKFLPPTDSLYKFMAIAGLMLILLSFLPVYFSFQVEMNIIESEKRTNLFFTKFERTERVNIEKFQTPDGVWTRMLKEIEKNGKLSEDSISLMKNSNNYIKNYELFNQQLKDINSRADEVGLSLSEKQELLILAFVDYSSQGDDQVLTDYLEIQKNRKILKLNTKMVERLSIYTDVLFFFGILLTLLGFYFWYIKIQKPNDLLLSLQTKENSVELNEFPPSHEVTEVSVKEDEDITPLEKRKSPNKKNNRKV